MIKDQNRLWDGWQAATGGQDAGKNPALIGSDQFAQLENCVCRGGWLKTRPAFTQMSLNYTNPTFSYDLDGFSPSDGSEVGQLSNEWFHNSGMFQCASFYAPPGSEACMMASIGGRLFRCVPRPNKSIEVYEVPIPDKRNRVNIPLVYMVQADRFNITQDGESTPIIYDGTSARRANPDEVPAGNEMAYGMGRLVVVRQSSREIIFGDLYGSHAGPDPGLSVLKFTETGFLAEGGSATTPFSLGQIVACIFYPQQDTASGNGELLVFAEKGMASFFLSLPREQWKDSAFQRLGLLEIGGRGHRSFTAVNGDIWFRSEDGWRTYRQARAEIHGWLQLPLSTEVDNYLNFDTPEFLKFGSSIHFDNRLIMTCNPVPNMRFDLDPDEGYQRWPASYNQGLLALDFDVLSSFGTATKPAWDGHWSNLKTYQLVVGAFNGVERAFAFGPKVINGVQDSIGTDIFEISLNDTADYNGPITSTAVSRSMTFEQPFNEKKLYDGDNWHDQIRKNTTVSVSYRPDQTPDWLPWQTYAIDPIFDTNAIDSGGNPLSVQGYVPRKGLGKPPLTIDDPTGRQSARGYEFQTKMQWTGNCAIRKQRVTAEALVEKAVSNR